MRALPFAALLLLTAACGGEVTSDDALELSESDLATVPSIQFKTTGVVTRGTPTQGKKVRITYQAARLPDCRGTLNDGRPAWSITGYASLNGAAPTSFLVAGYNPAGTKIPTSHSLALPDEGELQLWFEVTNRWGCQAWDSHYGQNHRFTVAPSHAHAPDWMGNAVVNISRSGGGCDAGAALGGGFNFGTWARSRAADTKVCFEVWEPTVTDFDNPNLWQQLDARVYYRYRNAGPYQFQYLPLEGRKGNNARYRLELRGLDTFRPYQSACPDAALTRTADGQYVQSEVEFYFEVNGRKLWPAANTPYRALFEDYASSWSTCP